MATRKTAEQASNGEVGVLDVARNAMESTAVMAEARASVALDGETQSVGVPYGPGETFDPLLPLATYESVVPSTRTGRPKVAIVGYTEHRYQAPFDDPARPRDQWEIWGMNDLWRWLPTAETKAHMPKDCYESTEERTFTFDAWYDIHLPGAFTDATDVRVQTKVQWLQLAHPFPVYLPEALLVHTAGQLGVQPKDEEGWWKEALPSVEPFPAHGIVDRFGIGYFTNSVAWMTAHAILSILDPKGRPPVGAELGLWGVDMAVATEYARQRPSCEFWLGVAAGREISVTTPMESDLLKSAGMYGVEEDWMGAKLRSRASQLASQQEALRREEAALAQRMGEIAGGIREVGGALAQVTYQLGTLHHAVVTDRDALGDPFEKYGS